MTPSPPTSEPAAAPVAHASDHIGGTTLLYAVVGLAVGVGLSMAAMWAALHLLLAEPRPADARRSMIEGDVPQSSAPMLQPSIGHDQQDRDDLAAMHAAEDGVFDDLGWPVDPATHRARVPAGVVERVAAHRTAATAPAATQPEATR